jgi:hypothetical protein
MGRNATEIAQNHAERCVSLSLDCPEVHMASVHNHDWEICIGLDVRDRLDTITNEEF